MTTVRRLVLATQSFDLDTALLGTDFGWEGDCEFDTCLFDHAFFSGGKYLCGSILVQGATCSLWCLILMCLRAMVSNPGIYAHAGSIARRLKTASKNLRLPPRADEGPWPSESSSDAGLVASASCSR